MLVLYVISTVVAGALVLLSLFGGDHGADHDVHVDAHHDGIDSVEGPWIPFFSVRFYLYFFASFGLCGLLLTFLSGAEPLAVALLSGGVGLVVGLAASTLIRMLRVSEANGAARESDLIGKEADVMVPIRGASPGRIRCSIRGDIIDFLAVTEEARSLEVGEKVIVVAMADGRAQVVSSEGIFDELPARVS